MNYVDKLDHILFESHPIRSLSHLLPKDMRDFVEVLSNRADANETDITIREMSKRRGNIQQYADVWEKLSQILTSGDIQDNEKTVLTKILIYLRNSVQTAVDRNELPQNILNYFGTT